jgi:hypothetical protein
MQEREIFHKAFKDKKPDAGGSPAAGLLPDHEGYHTFGGESIPFWQI